ncbi:MAG: tetratricopeptide repeat protein [Burkholderiaceae bacterium]
MKIGLDAPLAACLLAATLLAGCAIPSIPAQVSPASPSTSTAVVDAPSMSDDEVHDLVIQPPAEQLRRLDLVVAAHPGDVKARILRMDAEYNLSDFPSVLVDSEILLAIPQLEGRPRAYVLHTRAEALIKVERYAEAILVADQALKIDGSSSKALFARGWATFHSDYGQATRALADLDRALQIEPDQGIGYFRRAIVFEYLGRFALARSDLERALQLEPDDGPTRQQFAWLMFEEWYSGQSRQPIASFREQAARPDAYPYAPIWLFIVRIRANPADAAAARAELEALAPAHQTHDWMDTLVDLMLGKSSVEAAQAEADAAPTPALRADRRCDADYYAAELLLSQGPRAEATRLLEDAYRVCPSTSIESRAVVSERRLQAEKSAVR